MASVINAATSPAALIQTSDGTAVLKLQTEGTDVLVLDENQNVTVNNGLTVSGAVVFNDAGADVDFRVEGDTDANLLFVDASTDRVGIGTNSPDLKLSVAGAVNLRNSSRAGAFEIDSSGNLWVGTATTAGAVIFETGHSTTGLPSTGTVRARIDSDGLKFGSDTAAANALDDYEEGTWTPGVSFGGASAGVTFSASNSGRYTKIGRSVTVIGLLELTNKGSSTGDALITGLPFTVASGEPNYGGVAIGYVSAMTFADVPFGRTSAGSTNLALSETTNAGVATTITNSDFANNTALRFTCTYFV